MQTVAETSYFKTIDELPLNKFIDCSVDGNLSALIISGLPTEHELQEAWWNISGQYVERIGTAEYKVYKLLYKEIELLNITLTQVHILASRPDKERGILPGILRMVHSDFFAKEINDILKTNCKFNHKDPKSYHAELDKCVNRSKAIKIKRDLKLMTFEAIEKKNNSKQDVQIDREYFTSILVTLSDHAKYEIRDDIKMGQYCERVKRFIHSSEKNKK